MPIYAYRCDTCGHAKDVLQKISDPLLSVCPACGAATFRKQVTAAGFQLKGSGWYVTDFRDKAATGPAAAPKTDGSETAKPDAAKPADVKSDAPTPAPAPAASSGDSKAAASPSPAPSAPSSGGKPTAS